MRYLVTGGAGFIGSHLVEHLQGRGEDVTIFDDFSTGKRENVRPFEDSITIIEGSVTDPHACARAAEGVHYVFHLAAMGSVPLSIDDPKRNHLVNATGTLNMLEAARSAGVRRLVLAASTSAYGDIKELPHSEQMAPRPLSPYAVTKIAGEDYCRAYWGSYGFQAISLRFFNVFGPRQDPTSHYAAVIPLFIRAALEGRAPRIFGDGEQSRDFVYVTDVVQANMKAMHAEDEAVGEIFNVGQGRETTVNELWETICSLAGSQREAEYVESRAGEVRRSRASIERARAILGYEPGVDVEMGLKKTFEWYKANVAS